MTRFIVAAYRMWSRARSAFVIHRRGPRRSTFGAAGAGGGGGALATTSGCVSRRDGCQAHKPNSGAAQTTAGTPTGHAALNVSRNAYFIGTLSLRWRLL